MSITVNRLIGIVFPLHYKVSVFPLLDFVCSHLPFTTILSHSAHVALFQSRTRRLHHHLVLDTFPGFAEPVFVDYEQRQWRVHDRMEGGSEHLYIQQSNQQYNDPLHEGKRSLSVVTMAL